MRTWFQQWNAKLKRRVIVPVVAAVMTVSVASYEFAKPASAAVAEPAPAAAPLDGSSVEALLSLDQAQWKRSPHASLPRS